MSSFPRPRHRRPRAFARLLVDVRGAAAVEFAAVSGALLVTIVFVLFASLLLYINQALDRATSFAARQIMTGAVQKQNMTQGTFINNVVCPTLPALFTCSNVIVNVQTTAEAAGPNGYYSFVNSSQTALLIPSLSNAGTSFNPGSQGDFVYLQVIYPVTFLPAFFNALFGSLPSYGGSPAYLSISTAAFVNEQY